LAPLGKPLLSPLSGKDRFPWLGNTSNEKHLSYRVFSFASFSLGVILYWFKGITMVFSILHFFFFLSYKVAPPDACFESGFFLLFSLLCYFQVESLSFFLSYRECPAAGTECFFFCLTLPPLLSAPVPFLLLLRRFPPRPQLRFTPLSGAQRQRIFFWRVHHLPPPISDCLRPSL